MLSAPQDLLFIAHPVDPLLSIHGRCRDGNSAFGDDLLAEGTEGFSWRLGGGGPGESGHPVADCLLVGSSAPGASPWPCRVEAVL